jgi:hypothetical protein
MEKKMCFRHNSHFGTVSIKAVDKNVQRAEQEKEYLKLKKQFLKDHPVCQVKGCTKKACDVHHQKGRLGALLTNMTYFLGVCRGHHKTIEQNPRWSREQGYSVSRLAK